MKIKLTHVKAAEYEIAERGALFALVERNTRNVIATRATRAAVLAYAVAMGLHAAGVTQQEADTARGACAIGRKQGAWAHRAAGMTKGVRL